MQTTISLGRPPLPREHGGWAMLITPPAIALLAAGPSSLGLMAMLGWFFGYCLRGPLEALQGASPTGRAGLTTAAPEVARFWLLCFGAAAALLLGPVLILRPGALLLVAVALLLMMGVRWLAARGQTRSIIAGALATLGLMAGGPLYYLAAHGRIPTEGWGLALASSAFFLGSIFRVKTLAREKRSASFRWLSVAVHLAAVLAGALFTWRFGGSWLLPASLVSPLIWAFYGAVRAGEPVSLAAIGRGEQWLTLIFGLLLIVALRM